MIRIGRDHGALRHEVGRLPLQELHVYAAHYKHEQNMIDKEEARQKAKANK